MPILFRPVVACVELKFLAHWSAFSDTAVMTLHAKTPTSAPDAAVIEEIVSIAQTWLEDSLSNQISSDWTVYSIYGESMAVDPPPFFSISTNVSGTLGGGTEAAYAPLALLHGPQAARSQLGRAYFFAPDSGSVTDDGYSPTLLAGIVSSLQDLDSGLVAGGYNLAVPSKKHGQCVFVNSITHSIRKTMQKRRRPGFGG